MDDKLSREVIKRVEGMTAVETLLIFSVASLHLAVVAGCIRADQFMPDIQISCCLLKKCGEISFGTGKTICKLKAVIGLYTLYANAAALIPCSSFPQEISRRIC